MSKTLTTYPRLNIDASRIDDLATREIVDELARAFETLRTVVREAVNFNRVQYVSQNAQPTPDAGAFMVWKDADATSSNPTHYLVYNDGGTVVTFASEEVVP